jgi:Glyoxalase-like domain
MARALDHLVLGVSDLDVAGARFAALGFTVGPVNAHPWGTRNRLIQFADETFLELITVADPGAIPPHAPRHFSFGAFVRDALAKKTGLSMLALKSADAVADAAGFAQDGIGDFVPFHFARKGKRPDGSEVEVAFSLAFAAAPAMPECGFFVCQQHAPQNFWSGPAQQHANGATGLRRVTLVAENPADHHIFLAAFVGERTMRATSFGIEIAAGGSVIEIVTAEGFQFRYGTPAPAASAPTFAGLEIALPNPEGMQGWQAKGFRQHAGGLTAAADPVFATVLRLIPEEGVGL